MFAVRLLFISNPVGCVIMLISLAFEAIWYFYKEQSKDELKLEIYKFYCMVDEIFKSLTKENSPLASIVNFNAKYYGNQIAFKINDTAIRKYLTTPNFNSPDKALMYSYTIKEQEQQNDNLTIKEQRLSSSYEFAFSQFPLINNKEEKLKDSNITQTSAFIHLKNISTQFSNLLWIQTPYFTSTLTLDFLLQSLIHTPNSKAIHNKTIICISNIVEVNHIHYQIQNHIRDSLLKKSNFESRKAILFLNLIQNIDKKIFFENFKNEIYQNFKVLEDGYNKTAWFDKNYSVNINSKLNCLEKVFYDNKLELVAHHFYDLNECICNYEEYFKQEHLKTNMTSILKTLLTFDSTLCNFLDFKVSKKDNNSVDTNDLEDLRNKLRGKLQEIILSPNIFCVSHIFNNALFALNPNNELKDFRAFLEETLRNENFNNYKNLLVDYLDKIELREVVEFILPFDNAFLWLNFFSYEIQNELCAFLIYLFDLDVQGAFIKILQDYKPFKEIIKQINGAKKNEKIDLKSIIKNTLGDKIEKEVEDAITQKFENLATKDLKFINSYIPFKKSFEEYIHKTFSETLRALRDEKNLSSKKLVEKLRINEFKNLESNEENKIEFYKQFLQNEDEKLSIESITSQKFINKLSTNKINFKSSIGAFLITSYIDYKFETLKEVELERAVTLFALGMSQKRDNTYAKWCKDNFFIAKNLSKSLIIADFKHSLLMDNALDTGYCTHNPSLAAYTKNEDLAQEQFKELIKQNSIIHSSGKYYDEDYFTLYQDNEATHCYSEAYYKIYAYIDLIKDEQYNFNTLNNNTLMKQKMQDQNIKEVYPDRDFAIALKRVAEYNYKYYKGDTGLKLKEENGNFNKNSELKEHLLNNFIYNEGFIPTEIDIKE